MAPFAQYVIPAILAAAGAAILFSKKDLFGEFVAGARDALGVTANLVPTLVALMAGISMLRESGALEIVTRLLEPALSSVGIPREIAAFVLLRPLSGGGSTAMLSDIFASSGADSYVGRAASVIMGSTDTMFYIFAVYFGAAGVRRTGYALPAALASYAFCVLLACFLARIL